MKFGVREICDVVFKALQNMKIGDIEFVKGQPVLYIDTAKTSTMEGAATTVYATGGKGNARLIAWEGEKTLTFTVEDALLSPIGFAVLSGAGLFNLDNHPLAMVHCTAVGQLDSNGSLEVDEPISTQAPVFVTALDKGSVGTKLIATVSGNTVTVSDYEGQVFVDYYTEKRTGVTEIQIDAEHFAGFYYVEASTLFRREEDGKDMPAEIVFPRVKIQSNFTFNMAATGDPSTFTFTMDAFPAYTMFDKKKKVLCAIQVVAEDEQHIYDNPVTRLENADSTTGYKVGASYMKQDSVVANDINSVEDGFKEAEAMAVTFSQAVGYSTSAISSEKQFEVEKVWTYIDMDKMDLTDLVSINTLGENQYVLTIDAEDDSLGIRKIYFIRK